MNPPQARRSARNVAQEEARPGSESVHLQDFADIEQPRDLCLDDLPVEIIQLIAQFVRSSDDSPVFGCFCEERAGRIGKRAFWSDLSNSAPDSYSDPSWAFACVSGKFRDIVFHGNTTRSFTFEYSTCCITKVVSIPESIRASVTYVSNVLPDPTMNADRTLYLLPFCQSRSREGLLRVGTFR